MVKVFHAKEIGKMQSFRHAGHLWRQKGKIETIDGAQNLDALLISNDKNRFYLSGF